MNFDNPELSGRSIAQCYWTELEKIAAGGMLRSFGRGLGRASAAAQPVAEAAGNLAGKVMNPGRTMRQAASAAREQVRAGMNDAALESRKAVVEATKPSINMPKPPKQKPSKASLDRTVIIPKPVSKPPEPTVLDRIKAHKNLIGGTMAGTAGGAAVGAIAEKRHEKVALSPAAMAAAANRAAELVKETKAAVGLKRLIPGSAEFGAVQAAKARSARIGKLTEDAMKRVRGDSLELLRNGTSRDSAKAREMLSQLHETKKTEGALDAARRRMGLKPKYNVPEKSKGLSPGARKLLTGVGLVGAGAAGAFAGEKYLSSRDDQQYGY